MKKLLIFLLCQVSLDGFSQVKITTLPGHGVINQDVIKPDTLCASMHLSIRDNGFVIARKALAVRVNGICIQHLQSNGRPFPVHYRVGWCEGREEVYNQLVKLLNEK
jgi:hypothetical protein